MDELLKIFGTMERCADKLDDLNEKFPKLASEYTRACINNWQEVKERVEFDQTEPEKKKKEDAGGPDIKSIAIELMSEHELEDVLDILADEHKIELDMAGLIDAIGTDLYIDALRRDARGLSANSISYNQIASLWNDMERPCVGGEAWESRNVAILVE